ncbi:MAG: TetR/AcrR family transcriptional regulator [Nocardiaceae bacterium]|nr:TetR/AcrR family transcriptional regulator [Nocardiaceae bacterium]
MARYAPEHKDATRRRMIETAGRRFKSDGFAGSGIATLVGDAGLTNGAFYSHFESKDDLITTVVAEQIAAQAARIEALPVGIASVEAFLRDYLSAEHRDNPADGCPSAALLDEISRCSEATRSAYTDGAHRMIQAIVHLLDAGDTPDAYDRAIGLYTLLVSSLQLARAVNDPALSDQILSAAYRNAMTIAASTTPPSR